MDTMKAAEFCKTRTTHTGAVSYGYGKRPFTAAIDGWELKDRRGLSRTFKTADAAVKAIRVKQDR